MAGKLVDAFDEMRHGHPMRMLGARVATGEVRFGDSAQDDPAAGIDQALEDVRVDADSGPDQVLHWREVAVAVEDLVPVELSIGADSVGRGRHRRTRGVH